jgi:hypothetical protein
MTDVAAPAPLVPGAEGRLVDDRPGDIDQRVELARLLQVAAAIEHSLMVQYLYAAYSADVVIASGKFDGAAMWQQQLLTIAREEMGHLMTVQNALRLIGAEPNWQRHDAPWDAPYYPFPMEFEPFRSIAIEKYVYAEMDPSIDEIPPPGRRVPPWRKNWETLRVQIDADVRKATGTPQHVGKLFHDLLARLRDPTLTDDRWFDPYTYSQQASWDAWGKGYRPHPEDAELEDPQQPPNVIIAQMGTRTELINGVIQIAGQGEAPHLRHPRTRTPSHFDRFMTVYDGIAAAQPPVDPFTIDLPTNPTTQPPPDEGDEATTQRTYISHPASRLLADLCDLRYRMLVTNLGHAHVVAAAPEPGVRATGGYLMQRAFAEMFNVKTLSGLLFRSPLTDKPADRRRAGPPFHLPTSLALPGNDYDKWWALQLELTQTSLKYCNQLLTGPNAPPPGGSERFVVTLAQLDRNEIARIKAISRLPDHAEGAPA